MNLRTLSGKAIAVLLAAVFISALLTSFGGPRTARVIADMAVLAAALLAIAAAVIEGSRR
jgi:hypothetical protein